MKTTVEELLELAGDVDRILSPSDRLSELMEAVMAQYDEDELWEDELDLVAAAGKGPEKPTDGMNHK